uniref:Uncharacterized protein n=1 Tax=Candidatus Kentrum sp. TC TaxID=2126339 RepID=A0A450YXL7_9GAMM|nr:MAG: hypothetical protein BECKTC1821D_GA0114238_102915 [Candidatus Kentron sp. TC]
MSTGKFISDIQETLEQLKAKGIDKVPLDNLIAYLSRAASDFESGEEVDKERYKAELQQWVEEYRNIHARSVEMMRATITTGQSALRAIFLMNGGSSVAMLAFISHLATNAPSKVHLFSMSLTIFIVGVLVSSIASGTTYLSTALYEYGEEWAGKAGSIISMATILLGIGSYVVFAYGIHEAYSVLSGFA